jgi:type IV pilus assembly protein PilQ
LVENRKSPHVKVLSLMMSVLMIILAADAGFAADRAKETAPAKEVEAATPAKEAEVSVPAQAAPSAQVAAEIASQSEEAAPAAPVDPGNVTVNFKQADIRTVLSYIADVSGVDIVPAPEVKGVIDLKLTNKPWKTALDIIMRNYGLAYERDGDIIRVVTVDKLQQEELATQAFKLNYGNAKDIIDSIKPLLSEKRGKVTYDARTNMAIITDIPTKLYKIGEIVSNLDNRTQQVLIDARVIETTLGDTERLGIDWNVVVSASGAKRPTTLPFDYFNTSNSPISKYLPLVQTGAAGQVIGPGGAVTVTNPGFFPTGADSETGGGSKGFPYVDMTQTQFQDAFKFGTLDFSQFSAVLEMIKRRSDTDVVANPRIATLNNKEATINVTTNLPVPTYERNSTTGKMEITGYTSDQFHVGTILKVVPHINDKDEIVIDLNPEILSKIDDQIIAIDQTVTVKVPIIASSKASTQVRVKDGDTIFIGGLIREENAVKNNKLPFLGDMLGDVPYLGLLVSRKETVKLKREIIFFITVNIVTPGKIIVSSPRPEKASTPQFTATQQVGAPPKKKNKWFWQK